MTKRYNKQWFVTPIDENGVNNIIFACWTTKTKNGFCHTVQITNEANYCREYTQTKVSYYNRTWERFCYESAIKRAAAKVSTKILDKVCSGDLTRTY